MKAWSDLTAGRSRLWAALLLFLLLVAVMLRADLAQSAGPHDDWWLQEGFVLEIDSQGFTHPTSIAFVPRPGPGPKDPLYFVSELAGTIKVVTNDRSVHVFVDEVYPGAIRRAPAVMAGEAGLAGLCLDPERGYLFATSTYLNEAGELRNGIVRFETTPRTFALQPAGRQLITAEVLSQEPRITPNHQIGTCVAADETLYVGVGDGGQAALAQAAGSHLGKVLRMTLDGLPLPDNPFYTEDGAHTAADYVWALGLRSPFGLVYASDRLFVADNGIAVDRFLAVEKGANYLWDGADQSIATNAAYVFLLAVGPAQMARAAEGVAFGPDRHTGDFYVASSVISSGVRQPGVLAIPYDVESSRMAGKHRWLLRYQGSGVQLVVGLAFGPDGLYFSPMFADSDGRSYILKVKYAPGQAPTLAPGVPATTLDARQILVERGCLRCHVLEDVGIAIGPSLDHSDLLPRLASRLPSPEYRQLVSALDRREDEPFPSFRAARAAVLNAQGVEQMRLWVAYRLLEPRFDDPEATMPNLGLSRAEAEALAAYLLPDAQMRTRVAIYDRLRAMVPDLRYRHLAIAFSAGLATGLLLLGVVWLARARLARRSPKE